MFGKSFIIPGIVFAMSLGSVPGQANDSLAQKDAQFRLKQLKTEIVGLMKELEHQRSRLSDEQEMLREADLEIQTSVLQLRELETARQGHDRQLSDLQTQRKDYLDKLGDRRDLLAAQILAAYRLGRESRLKLILNQDSPALLSRALAYYDYFSRSQASQISELKRVLQVLDQMQAKINLELSALAQVQTRQQLVLDDMKRQQDLRQTLIDRLSGQIGTGETRLAELQRNRKDLETLLNKLTSVLADIPSDLGTRVSPKDLQGKMPIPVAGRVRHAFGQRRSTGLQWQGWQIAADYGTDVRAVAYGRVAYADWLRGYGLLMIIDHGDGFMTLYANNESLLHELGDWVEPRAVISTVGNSPLNGSGIYFEIRKNGKAMDPALWLKR